MSYPHLQDQPQHDLAYPLSRRRRRWLVALMLLGAIWTLLWTSLATLFGPGGFLIGISGMLISFGCYLVLYLTMKGIHQKPPRSLDERQNRVSSQSYRTAFHILMICGTIAYLLSMYGGLDWINLQINGIWILTMMAWTEPD